MTTSSKRDRIPQFICRLCGNWGITGPEVVRHGPRRASKDGLEAAKEGCRKIRYRAKKCPICPTDFADQIPVHLVVVKSFKKTDENGQLEREERPVFRRRAWSGKRIYEHLIEHRVKGEHVR